MILAIDPGDKQSAMVVYDAGWPMPLVHRKVDNDLFVDALRRRDIAPTVQVDEMAIEMIASYGMPVGREVFETCLWIGRFIEAWGGPYTLVYRRDVKLHLCGQARAKDGNVRQAIIDRFGGKQSAIGNKKTPGPLYGVSGDVWQALAVAITFADTRSAA